MMKNVISATLLLGFLGHLQANADIVSAAETVEKAYYNSSLYKLATYYANKRAEESARAFDRLDQIIAPGIYKGVDAKGQACRLINRGRSNEAVFTLESASQSDMNLVLNNSVGEIVVDSSNNAVTFLIGRKGVTAEANLIGAIGPVGIPFVSTGYFKFSYGAVVSLEASGPQIQMSSFEKNVGRNPLQREAICSRLALESN